MADELSSSSIDRAAEIIKTADIAPDGLGGDLLPDECRRIAEALAAADPPLLVTHEIQAVLDAVGFDSRTDGRDPTSMTGHARATTEHEVASPSDARKPTGPTEQADLQDEPTTGHRPPEVERLVAAALDLDAAFQLDRAFENAAVVREFRLACQAVRDLDRTGQWESDAD